MKRFKRVLRLMGLIVLMVLASVGIGLGGGVPIPASSKKEDIITVNIELVEEKEDGEEVNQVNFRQ